MGTTTILLGSLLLASAGPALPVPAVQGTPAAPSSPQGGKQPRIRIEGDQVFFAVDEEKGVPFLEFVKFAQKVTGKTFYIDVESDPTLQPDAPQNRIRLLGTLKIKTADFFDFFQTVLYIKGWAVIPRGGESTQFYQIVKFAQGKANEVKKGARFIPPEDLERYKNRMGMYIVTTLRLKNINANIAANNLRAFYQDPLTLDNFYSLGDGQTQRVVMLTGFAPTVYTMVQLLRLVDVKEETPKATLRTIRLKNNSSEDIKPILDELLAERPGRPTPPQGQAGAPEPEDLIPVKILENPSKDALIVYAHEKKIREIEAMVAQLDTKITTYEGNYRVYRLKNTLAKEIQATVRDFIRQAFTAQQQGRGGGGNQAAGTTRREAPPVVIADEKSNSLLISATKSQYEKIAELLRKIDVRQPQVLIEAALIELATQDLDKLGVELGLLDLGGDKFTRPFAFTSHNLTTFQDTDGNGLPDTRLPDFENPLQGFTGGIITSGDFAIPVVVNALKSNTRANVLSIPSILVNNNGEATIESKDSFPTTTSQVGNVTTQTNFSGFQDAGIVLSISPSISEGNYLKLNIRLEVSKFTGQFDSNSAVPPPKTVRKIETEVTMPSGHTMVFGGVIEDQSSETNDGIPILKDLPIIGALFRSTENTNRKTNLYFFLTPHILNEEDFSDLAKLTFEKKLEASKYIGHQRMKIVDPSWKGREELHLDDPEATIEDLDRLGGFEIPSYERPPAGEGTPNTEQKKRLEDAEKKLERRDGERDGGG